MDDFFASLGEWLSGPAGGLAAIAAAVIAIWGIAQTASDARAKAQPTLVAELRPAPHADRVLELVIRNTGPSVARNVKVTFDPPIPTGADPRQDNSDLIARRYAETIPNLAPGAELINTWWFGDYRKEPVTNLYAIGEADRTVRFEYRGLGRRLLKDEYVIRTELALLASNVQSSDSVRGRLKTIDASLASIRDSLKKIAGH